jgi:N utilization substance protein B
VAERVKGSRQQAREAVLQMMYAIEVGGQSAADVEHWYVQNHPLAPAVREWAGRLLDHLANNGEKIEQLISANLKDWRMERLSVIDRSLLKLGTAELLAGKEPVPVVISENLRLARKFSQPDVLNFLNGVLDAIARQVRGSETTVNAASPRRLKIKH